MDGLTVFRHSPAISFGDAMMLDYTHLEALLAVKQTGSFEGAAKELGMSPIGVSARIKKLETRMGVKLLTRKPTKPTKAGASLCEYAASVVDHEDQLLAELRASGLQSGHETKRLKIAITDDSLTCWFADALSTNQVDEDHPLLFDVTLSDLDHTIDLMRNGEVIAALTSSVEPVHGFKSYRLGDRSYKAVASPDFVETHFDRGVTSQTISQAHCIRHSSEDTYAFQWLEHQFGTNPKLLCTRLPKLQLMIEMCTAGSGWSVLPEPKIAEQFKDGSLVELIPDTPLIKTIHWHIAQSMIQPLADLTKSVRSGFPGLKDSD